MAADRGRMRSVTPVLQISVPLATPPTELMTQTLVGVLLAFGTANGAPKRHPAEVQVRLLPVAVDVVEPRPAVCPVHAVIALTAKPRSGTEYGSGTELPPPPV